MSNSLHLDIPAGVPWIDFTREFDAPVAAVFEAMGVDTGIDLNQLMAARAPLQAGLPGEPLYGMTPEAGLPKGWPPQK